MENTYIGNKNKENEILQEFVIWRRKVQRTFKKEK